MPDHWRSLFAPIMLQCMSLLLADFVAEVI
jgi:hypothetical protein